MQKRIVIGILGAALGALLTGCAGNSSAQRIMPIQGPDGLYYIVNNDGEAEIVDPRNYVDDNWNRLESSASGDLVIPEIIDGYKVTVIQRRAFAENSDIQSVSIPGSVKEVGEDAFSGCRGLTAVTLSDGIKKIQKNAFYGTAITDIIIPSSVVEIGSGAFDCSSLTSAEFYGSYDFSSVFISTPWLENIEAQYENSEFCIINDTLVKYNGNSDHVEVPSGIRIIGNNAFAYDYNDEEKNLTQLVLPETVEYINYGAFNNCENLSEINLPGSVVAIEESAFSGCKSLVNIVIPDGVTEISAGAFKGCSALTSIAIPDSVTKIGSEAFSYCSSLTDINIPDSVITIGSQAFYDCSINDIDLPDSLIDVATDAFNDTLLYDKCSGDDFLIIDDVLLDYRGNSNVINIPDGVRLVVGSVLGNRSVNLGIRGAIVIPESVETIYDFYPNNFSEIKIDGKPDFYRGDPDKPVKGLTLMHDGNDELTDLYLNAPTPIDTSIGIENGITIHYNGKMYSVKSYVAAYERDVL